MIKQQSFNPQNPLGRRGASEDGVNQATNYAVQIVPTTVADNRPYWKVIKVQHLSPDENAGKHNVFVDALDEAGQRCQNAALRIGWTWEGRRADEPADPKLLDKPTNEPAGNVDLYKGQLLQVWIEGDNCPSDRVENLHTNHPDENNTAGTLGNSIGHHSFHVVFQRMRNLGDPDTPPSGGNPSIGNGNGNNNPPGGGSAGGDQSGNLSVVDPLPLPVGADATTVALVNTWNHFGDLIQAQANQLNIDPSVAVAVLMAESAGEPFGPDGRMVIRFENHIFYQYWGREHEDQFRQCFAFNPDQGWQGQHWRPDVNAGWLACHLDQRGEWQAFEFARTLDEHAALCSISMGAPQIMGFNYQMIGYATVQEMFQAFQADARNQLTSLFRFMQVNGLVDAVRNQDFSTFVSVYNGPGQANYYANLIRSYMTTFQSLRATPAPRGVDTTATARSPMPQSPVPGKPLSEADPELYAAWRKHIQQGFENNQTMFGRVLDGFMDPYWTTVWMYRALFGIGVGAFIVAAILGILSANRGNTSAAIGAAAVFGGLGIVAFLTYFVNRPLQALEENLQFITWLGVIYNTYWTRLAYTSDLATVQQELEAATTDTIAKIKELLDKHTELSGKRPNLPNKDMPGK